MTQVKVKVRPDQVVQFPNICVHCSRPGSEQLGLEKRIGRVTRLIDVPLCADCERELHRRSGEEERYLKLGWVATAVMFILTLGLMLLFTPSQLGLGLQLLVTFSVAGAVGAITLMIFRRAAAQRALLTKQEIQTAVSIDNFSWRATTFYFTNETFAERFEMINKEKLMNS